MAIKPAGRGPQLLGIVNFFLALTTVAIILRTYCRVYLVKSFGWDDWSAVIAWIFFVFFCSFATTGVFHGTGQHAQDIIPPAEIPIGIKWWWACEPVYVLSNMALKFSIGIMLLRLTIKPLHRWIIYGVLVVSEIYSLFFFFLFVLQCRPSAYFWTQYTGGKGTCINPQITVDATYAYSAISCLGDWIFAILPGFMVWNLKMNSRTKLSVAIILGVGGIASAATIVRIPYVSTLKNQSDFLYATVDVAIWSCAETGLGIAACSIATLRPLFRAFLARSHLWGGTSSGMSNAKSLGWSPHGIRSDGGFGGGRGGNGNGRNGEGEIALRSDMRKDQGVTTTIGGGGRDEEETFGNVNGNGKVMMTSPQHSGSGLGKSHHGFGKGVKRSESGNSLTKHTVTGGWRSSDESKRSLGSSSDDETGVNWKGGIKKTTAVSRQVII